MTYVIGPALIILDMFMPGMDGWYCLNLRSRRWHSVPVLVTTALKVGSDEWPVSLGTRGLLEKPVDPAILLKRVRSCLGTYLTSHEVN